MKKYISYLLTLALLIPAFVSCTEQLEDLRSKNQKTHTVYFSTTDQATKTGLTIEDNMVKPYWQKTDLENIHFFEIDANNAAAPGTADAINLSDDNRTAHFTAAISDDITIIVSPTDGDNGSKGAKSAGVSPFTFAAVVAQMPDKDAYTFVIPSEQHPDAETLKDPNAEFLVGYSRKSYAEQYDYESNVVDLYFDRVAALGRLAISGFIGTGEKVKSVTITANGGMTGKATYPGDFTLGDKNKVNFTKVNEPLVLAYGDGVAAPAEDPFYAYFVAVPGEATVTSIEVLTDQYKYTKTVAEGAKFTFTDEQLLNIVFALSADIAEAVTSESNTWYKASVLEAGQKYLIVSQNQALKNNEGATAAVAVSPVEGIITFESNVDPTIVWTAAARTEMTGTGTDAVVAGNFTLENSGVYLQRKSNNTEQEIVLDAEPSNKKYFVWDYVDNYLKHESSSTVTFFCSYNNGWVAGNTTNGAAPGTDIKTVEIYNNRPPVEISFASAEAKYDLDNKEWTVAVPELTAPEGATITYSSSNEDIATVAADGTVTPKAVGSAVITATVTGSAEYQGGAASYTLEVTSSKVQTFYLASEIQAGVSYLIVSGKYAMALDGTTIKSDEVTGNAGDATIQLPASTVATLFIAAEKVVNYSGSNPAGHYTLSNGSNYLYRASDGATQTVSVGTLPTNPTKYYVWEYDGEYLYHISSSSNTFYLGYNSGWVFVYSNSIPNTYLYTTTRPLPSRNLSYPQATYTAQMGTSFTAPELGGVTTGVKYESSDTGVATVDENTGAVTLVAAGTTTITASADATDEYAAGSASYKLTVSDGSVVFFVKVTELSELNTSDTFIITNTADNNAFKAVLDGSTILAGAGNTNAFTLTSDGKIVDDGTFEACKFTLEEKGTKYNMYFSGVERYIYPSGSSGLSNKVISESPSADQAIAFSVSGGNWTLDRTYNNGSRYFVYNTPGSGDPYFQTSATSSTLHLFKLEGSGGDTPTLLPRSLSFPQATYTAQMGTSFTAPELGGVTTGVKYTSSDTGVATVDKDTGTVTLVAAGTTTITASADATDEYAAGSAQYTLTVNPAAGDMVTIQLKKATSLTAGQKYILVSNGFALMKNGDDASVVTFNADERTITVPNSSIDDVKWALEKKTSSISNGNEYVFTNGTYYFGIAMNTNPQTYTYTVEVNDGRTVSNNVTIQDHNINLSSDYIYYSGTSSAYYIFYNTSTNIWDNEKVNKSTGSPAATSKTALYVVDDGSGGDPGDDPTPTTSTYTRISGDADLVTGTYLIVNKTDAYLFNASGSNNGGYSNIGSTTGITKDGSTITLTSEVAAASEFVITRSGNNLTIKQVGGSHAGQYMYATANTSDTYIGFQASSANFVINAQNGDLVYFSTTKSTSDPTEYLYKKSADSFFKLGGSGSPGGSDAGVYLYKKVENP